VVDFNLSFFQFIWERNSENIIKIGPYLPKLLQEKFGAVFFGPPCIHYNATIMIERLVTQQQIQQPVSQWQPINKHRSKQKYSQLFDTPYTAQNLVNSEHIYEVEADIDTQVAKKTIWL